MPRDEEPLGWVLYDAACGFCTWWIPFWQKTIRRAGYDIAPLQAAWVRARTGLADASVNRDILLLMKDGTIVQGADAYMFGMKRVWWSRPVGHLLGWPGMKQLTWMFYRWFNKNRFFVSRVCRLPPGQVREGSGAEVTRAPGR